MTDVAGITEYTMENLCKLLSTTISKSSAILGVLSTISNGDAVDCIQKSLLTIIISLTNASRAANDIRRRQSKVAKRFLTFEKVISNLQETVEQQKSQIDVLKYKPALVTIGTDCEQLLSYSVCLECIDLKEKLSQLSEANISLTLSLKKEYEEKQSLSCSLGVVKNDLECEKKNEVKLLASNSKLRSALKSASIIIESQQELIDKTRISRLRKLSVRSTHGQNYGLANGKGVARDDGYLGLLSFDEKPVATEVTNNFDGLVAVTTNESHHNNSKQEGLDVDALYRGDGVSEDKRVHRPVVVEGTVGGRPPLPIPSPWPTHRPDGEGSRRRNRYRLRQCSQAAQIFEEITASGGGAPVSDLVSGTRVTDDEYRTTMDTLPRHSHGPHTMSRGSSPHVGPEESTGLCPSLAVTSQPMVRGPFTDPSPLPYTEPSPLPYADQLPDLGLQHDHVDDKDSEDHENENDINGHQSDDLHEGQDMYDPVLVSWDAIQSSQSSCAPPPPHPWLLDLSLSVPAASLIASDGSDDSFALIQKYYDM